MSADNSVGLTSVVGLSSPSHPTIELLVNPVASIVIVELLPPPPEVTLSLAPEPPEGSDLGVGLTGGKGLAPAWLTPKNLSPILISPNRGSLEVLGST